MPHLYEKPIAELTNHVLRSLRANGALRNVVNHEDVANRVASLVAENVQKAMHAKVIGYLETRDS